MARRRRHARGRCAAHTPAATSARCVSASPTRTCAQRWPSVARQNGHPGGTAAAAGAELAGRRGQHLATCVPPAERRRRRRDAGGSCAMYDAGVSYAMHDAGGSFALHGSCCSSCNGGSVGAVSQPANLPTCQPVAGSAAHVAAIRAPHSAPRPPDDMPLRPAAAQSSTRGRVARRVARRVVGVPRVPVACACSRRRRVARRRWRVGRGAVTPKCGPDCGAGAPHLGGARAARGAGVPQRA
mmetsp:Transcript_37670/g.111445  ORF Transcript_37670/g.111445 Transcript_37670/m.111445 type:complete len:241 (-) Transcript_37670:3073-3795(-)